MNRRIRNRTYGGVGGRWLVTPPPTRWRIRCLARVTYVFARPFTLAFTNLLLHPSLNERRDKSLKFSAQLEDLFDQTRANVRIGFSRHHENGFNARFQAAIHQSHL